MSPCVAVKWPDGKTQTASSWDELEDVVRRSQYDVPSPEGFRESMAVRARRWSGTEIMTTGTADDFFWELERAGMLRRTANGGEPRPDDGTPFIVDLDLWRNAHKTPTIGGPEGK